MTWKDPRAPSLTSLVVGIHAWSFSSSVASSIKPPGAYSEVNHFQVSCAPLKNATSAGFIVFESPVRSVYLVPGGSN